MIFRCTYIYDCRAYIYNTYNTNMIAYIYTTYNTYMIAVAMLAQVVSQAQLGPPAQLLCPVMEKEKKRKEKKERKNEKKDGG